MSKVLVMLSGGVDSAVAALKLKKEGYDIAGAYIKTWMNEDTSNDIFANCPWEKDIKDAKAVAAHLDIDFEVVNLIEEYNQHVVKYLVNGYKNGITPNPDIMCNKHMKFGTFLNYALNNGFTSVATGHYCQKIANPDGSHDLLQGLDPNKDQSYFLAMISQSALTKTLFPVGSLHKPQVRELAKEHNLPNADKKDSQGICFLGKIPINRFLKQYIPDIPGDIINHNHEVVGQHQGLHHFTIGQAKGLGIPSNTDFKKYVVTSKDFTTNTLHVAFDQPTNTELYKTVFHLRDLHFINKSITKPTTLLAKPRYRDPSQPVHINPLPNNKAEIQFTDPQRALTPGQILALYDNNVLLGGGVYL